MPIFRIPTDHLFPDPRLAERPSGLLGVGGDLHPARIHLAYRHGIFPWFSRGQPIYWWSPDPRMVLYPEELQIGRSLGKRIRQGRYRITLDQAFDAVIEACSRTPRPDQDGTWITPGMKDAYVALHDAGIAHSVEAWQDDELVGGLYGVAVGSVFAGESMFAHASDASKVAFATFVEQFRRWGGTLIDCQMHTPHLERFGARLIDRSAYLDHLASDRDRSIATSPWRFDVDFAFDGRPQRDKPDEH
jgi:leucyl/phenylalanyl-tRNA--protein transferase